MLLRDRIENLLNKKALGTAALILGATGTLILAFNHLGIILCPIYRTTGIPCPTCGATRAWVHLFKGELREAFTMHPLFLLVPFFLLFLFFYFKIAKNNKKLANILLVSFIALFLGAWTLRLILLFPHQEPMVWNEHAILFQWFRNIRILFH